MRLLRFLGKSKTEPETSLNDVIRKSKEAIETLGQKRHLLQRKLLAIDEETQGKTLSQTLVQKRNILFAEIEKLSAAQFALEKQVLSIEGTQLQAMAFRALELGVTAQKKCAKNANEEKVEEVLEEMRDQHLRSRDFSCAMLDCIGDQYRSSENARNSPQLKKLENCETDLKKLLKEFG